MTVRYHYRRGEPLPDYVCQREGIDHGRAGCTSIPGAGIDQAISELVLKTLTPLTLEVTLAVQEELQTRFDEADGQRYKLVERAQYEVDLAQRRYRQVEPENRLVADSLEGDWNDALRALSDARAHYDRQRASEVLLIDEEQRAQVMALAENFPALWRDPGTAHRERKRMLRLVLEDVTLHKDRQITAQVRFRGGATQTLLLPRPLSAGLARKYKPELLAEVDELLNAHTDAGVAERLNERGRKTSDGGRFHRLIVRHIRLNHALSSRHERLLAAGYLDAADIAQQLGIAKATVKLWRRKGWLVGVAYNDRPDYLYAPPDKDTPVKSKWKSRDWNKPVPQQP